MKTLCQILVILLVCAACQPKSDEAPFYAPDFTLTALDGTSYTLSALQGQWVIVTFWATTCPPCLEDMPLLQQMADDADGHLVVLGVNMREEPALIQPFLKSLSIRFPILLNPHDQILLDYNVIGLPQTFLITPTGEVIDRRFGPVDVEAWEALSSVQNSLYAVLAIDRQIAVQTLVNCIVPSTRDADLYVLPASPSLKELNVN